MKELLDINLQNNPEFEYSDRASDFDRDHTLADRINDLNAATRELQFLVTGLMEGLGASYGPIAGKQDEPTYKKQHQTAEKTALTNNQADLLEPRYTIAELRERYIAYHGSLNRSVFVPDFLDWLANQPNKKI